MTNVFHFWGRGGGRNISPTISCPAPGAFLGWSIVDLSVYIHKYSPVALQYPLGPVCDWPDVIDCTMGTTPRPTTPSPCNCEPWQDCNQARGSPKQSGYGLLVVSIHTCGTHIEKSKTVYKTTVSPD
jgi:hypothetical protein